MAANDPHLNYQVQCTGHEELRDIAITTRAEVRMLSGQMEQIMTSMEDLKADRNQRIGSERNSNRTAAIIAGVISSAGVVFGVIIALWRGN
jgi:tetrahydromethanopterin S-methyltransferase subunit F